MVKILAPGVIDGDFISNYDGCNLKIGNSLNKLTFQRITFDQERYLNINNSVKMCFEIELLGRKFLMVLDGEHLYEIVKEDGDEIYILLTNSNMFFSNHFEDGKKYVFHGIINLHYLYSENCEYLETFNYQLNLKNHQDLKDMLKGINENID
ncbi:hypothetical protein [Flavobacterium tegetincola]|uniref:hypothetical protein n=1 Tax=Flavobacterium tegetincola TaxID=150172 RepID=UPI00047D141D|nr:hypothetical protein [Flavobacterium tegetincola]